MIKIFFLFLFIASVLESFPQKNLSLKGMIISTDSSPISNASILVKNSDKIKAFSISKQNGNFLINMDIEKADDYLLEVSHIGYESKTQKIFLDKDTKNIHHFYFMLVPKNDELQEIVIKKNLPSVVVNQDTIEFNAKNYRTPEVRKVVDLLKNITGFTVDDKGHITYNGKEVEKILIEGDDLADKNYSLISKYLDASVVNKIQVLNNYNEDRLLKEVEKSGKVAVNLTIKENVKNKISGSVEVGSSFQGHRALDENLIYISRKIKALLLSNYNNIGNSSDADVQYYFNQGENIVSNTSNNESQQDIVKSGEIFIPEIGNQYTKSNNDFSSNFMSSWRMGKAIKARALVGYNIRALKNNDLEFNEVTLPSISKWSIATTDNSNKKANYFIAQTAIAHDNLKNNTGSYTFSITGKNDLNSYKSIASLAVTDTLSELLKNSSLDYHFSGTETFRLKNSKVLNVETGFMRDNVLQNFDASTNRLINYFLADSSFSLNRQKTKQAYNKEWITLKYLGKRGEMNYSFGLHAAFSQISSLNNISTISKNYADSIIVQPKSALNYEDSKYSAFLNLDTKFLKRNILGLGISAGYGEEKINAITSGQTDKSFLWRSYFEYRYIISGYKKIIANIQLGCFQPNPRNFYGQSFISGNATILDGASAIKITKTKEVSVSYMSNNLYNNSQLLINCILRNSSGEYNTGYYLTPSFNKNRIDPTNNNYHAMLNINFEKYYSQIRSKIVFQFNGMLMKKSLFMNDVLNNNASASIRGQFKYITVFKLPVNLETSCAAIYSQNKISNLQQSTNNNLWQYEGYVKLKIKATKKLYSNVVCNVFVFNPNNICKTLDSYIVYKCEKRWTFSLSLHNLFNEKVLVQNSISTNSVSKNSFYLVQRYVLAQVGFGF